MKYPWVCLSVVFAMACNSTMNNPHSCIDGVCSDPDFPFCDVDGTFGGAAKECINAGCTPGVFERCVGADVYTCNAFGNSFDVQTCMTECDDAVGGCRSCSTNIDCNGATPICDRSTDECRRCAADAECDSSVCESGSCVDSSTILYAAVDGGGSVCSSAEPCTASTAMMAAVVAGAPRTVHLSSGMYGVLHAPASVAQISIVGADAMLSGDDGGFIVDPGANVTARGLTITGLNDALACGQATGARASVTLQDSRLVQPDTLRILWAVNCEINLSNVELRAADVGDASASNSIVIGPDGSLIADRVRVHGLRTTMISVMGQRMKVKITNSILENVGFINLASDIGAPGTQILFAWNTFVSRNSDTTLVCASSNPNRSVHLENNIIFGTSTSDVVDTNCFASNNIMTPQTSLPAGNVRADPQFQDVATANYRLRTSSPGVNAGGVVSVPSDHDFLGAARPQGGAPDIGAYEQ